MKIEDAEVEITEFPEQDTFNFDNMIISDEKDGETGGICNADNKTVYG